MEINEHQAEPLVDTSHLKPGPIARGLGVSIAAFGLGGGALLASWGFMPLLDRLDQNGMRTGRSVTLVQDKPLELAPPPPLKIDPQQLTIKVDGLQLPKAADGKTADGEVIKREVTIFSFVAHGDGQVTTGWQYKDGRGNQKPYAEYCYYISAAANHKSSKVDIAENGNRLPDLDQGAVPDLDSALRKCQWWREADSN